jgi:hypothetical protein
LLDIQVGLHRTKEATFNSQLHEWSLQKGKEKKSTEMVHYWNGSLSKELEAEVDLYLHHLFVNDTEGKYAKSMPTIDYNAGGFDEPGIVLLFGGDHGDKHCPISCKMNLSPPQERKDMNDLGYQCPVVQFASVQCTKDSFEIMSTTVMPTVKQQLVELHNSSLLVVYHYKEVTKCFRSFMVPSNIKIGTIAFRQTTEEGTNAKSTIMTFAHGVTNEPATFGSLVIDDPVFDGVPYFELVGKVVITNFHQLFIGDLAFLAMLIGMNNSSGMHCLMCMFGKNMFNCEHDSKVPRTKESLATCLEQYMLLRAQKKNKANYKGVNSLGLWDIDPQRIIIPILHCPMGLVDKLLETFKAWVNMDVEDYHDDFTEEARSDYKDKKERHAASILVLEQAETFATNNPQLAAAKDMVKEAAAAKAAAKKAEAKAKETYVEQMQRHNAKQTSLFQIFEVIFRNNGITRESYHGGKFNGVHCIRIMERSDELFLGKDGSAGFLQRCLQSKAEGTSDETVETTCKQYARLLGILDAIWSKVRGVECGLLPTADNVSSLELALKEGKALWLAMGLTTLQPKWHLTFDGHLLEQYKMYAGLADKSDESIEKQHQVLKQLRDRFRGITSYEQRETCIRRELRRKRSPEIQFHIDKYEAMTKQSTVSKRALDAADRQESNKRAKQEKRDGYVQQQQQQQQQQQDQPAASGLL